MNQEKTHDEYHVKQNKFIYYFVRFLAIILSFFVFKRKLIRNEIKSKKGPFVIIANHEAALDFVNIIGATRRPLTFVISNSFYNTLPFKPIVSRLGMIPKQQFQTSLNDMHKMKTAIDDGRILVIYPSGLMSDDGAQTPTPAATYGFLKWLKTDVYVARTTGTYFSMPKWRHGGLRSGKTYMDIYKLFDKDTLLEISNENLQTITDSALNFDAYEDQEKYLVKYKNGNDIEGIENVLYMCPHCKSEFSMKVRDKSVIFCDKCGFEETADEYGFLYKTGGPGNEIRHPSKWNRIIHDELAKRISSPEFDILSSNVKVQIIPDGKTQFEDYGSGTLTISAAALQLRGTFGGEQNEITVPSVCFPCLPYNPGKYLEIQDGSKIYRCFPEDGRVCVKFIDTVKILYELHSAKCERTSECIKA